MSLNKNRREKAIKYNRAAAHRIGWEENFSEILRLLGLPPRASAKDFALGVYKWQKTPLDRDGMLGSKTWAKMKLQMNLANNHSVSASDWLSPLPAGIASIDSPPSKETTSFKVTASRLEAEFKKFGPPGDSRRAPCTRTGNLRMKNQCAARMCIALSRAVNANILEAYTKGCVHSSRCCSGPSPARHISSSQSLFTYLRDVLNFGFIAYGKGDSTIDKIKGKKGIVFFTKCFTRGNGTRGSHIDYWNGETYTNSAKGSAAAHKSLKMFKTAQAVYFCALP